MIPYLCLIAWIHFGKSDPDRDSHQSEKPDPNPHQNQKPDPVPHQSQTSRAVEAKKEPLMVWMRVVADFLQFDDEQEPDPDWNSDPDPHQSGNTDLY